MTKIVDAVINVYGKAYQTLAALKTLMLHSGKHIDKIYFIEEKEQPFNTDFNFIFGKFDNLIHFIPKYFFFISPTDRKRYIETDYRYSLRYQYAWENTDKKYLFIAHNDVIFKGDIIGEMLKTLHQHNDLDAGIGEVGACWNCPAFFAKKCNGDKYLHYNPSYEEVIDLMQQYPPKRTQEENSFFLDNVDIIKPMPLPGCRLNEWACLIDMGKIKHEVIPYGSTTPMGAYVGLI